MLILGIGGWLHSGAAAVLRDGKIVAAVEEEKIRRQSQAAGLPEAAIDSCLAVEAASRSKVDIVALARPVGGVDRTAFNLRLKEMFPNARLVVVDHHDSHAASAFYPSPFESARVLTLDRRGDMRCGAVWEGDASGLRPIRDYYSPDSPAVLYSRVTDLIGFHSDGEEHKTQWLSVRGEPSYAEFFERLLGLSEDGSLRLDHSYFDTSRRTHGGFGDRFYQEIGIPQNEPLDDKMKADLAASVHAATEKAVLAIAGEGENLCVAGGLAMNALLVTALEQSSRFQRVWVQPAAGNAGTALGAALHAWHVTLGRDGRSPLETLFLGPSHSQEEIKQVLENCKLRFTTLLTDQQVVDAAVTRLADDQIVAWFQGRTEFGPRALGARSLLASPLNKYSAVNLNQYIKRREDFRKFAASVPEEDAAQYFECGENAQYLTTVSRVKPDHRETFEAALLDGERARVHVVRRGENRLFWELLKAAGKKSGLPVLYNTSFNLFGEPLVSDPRAAVRSFYASGIDSMFVGGFLLEK